MSRTFTIESVYNKGNKLRFDGGRYISDTPSGAARKAFTQAYRHINGTGRASFVIHIRETTQGSSHKTYTYKVSRIKNPTVADWIKTSDSVVFEYTTKVRAV